MEREVQKGWGLVLPENAALKILDLELAPMGVAEHLGINDLGEYVPKKRVTNNLSIPYVHSKESINSRVN